MAKLIEDYNAVKNGKVSQNVEAGLSSNYHRKENAWTT